LALAIFVSPVARLGIAGAGRSATLAILVAGLPRLIDFTVRVDIAADVVVTLHEVALVLALLTLLALLALAWPALFALLVLLAGLLRLTVFTAAIIALRSHECSPHHCL
jgi:hypothetical protein